MPDTILIAKEPTQDLHEQIPATRLVFMDSQVENYQSLVAGVLPNTSVVVLDADQDGIEQISQVLATHRQINSLHIVSHGAPGKVYLGNSQLGYETLNRYAWQLTNWANALSADAQLLLYGCEVGQTQQGKAFVQRLSELTGAVVAASDDLTGSTALGGDWELEVSTGAIIPALAFGTEVMAAYASVLAVVVLDTSFNTTGKVTTNFDSDDDYGNSITVQSDGKILVAGISDNGTNNDFAIVRYNSDGTLDTSFSDGTLDTSFNATGKITTNFNGNDDYGESITVQADGKILVAGYTYNGTNNDFAIVRYNSNGTLDTSFNATGKVTTDFNTNDDSGYSIAMQADGKILVAGDTDNGTDYDFAIVRYNSNGTLDTSFNTTGKVTTDFNTNDDSGYSIAMQADGKILVAGDTDNGTDYDFAIVRYNSNGTLDTSFNTTGKVTTDFNSDDDYGYSITVQPDGKILVAGDTDNGTDYDFAIVRYNSNGTLDTSFNTTGKVTTDFNSDDDYGYSITVQPDGKILVAGDTDNGTNYDFAIVRYNSNGTLDTSFNTTGKVTTDFNSNYDYGESITVQPDGKILVAGDTDNGTDYDFAVARYLVNQVPEVANSIQDQEATEDSVFNFTVPVDTFSDADAEDILTYTATLANDDLLPTWLNFNPDTLTFTGTPTNNDLGSLDIKVTAKDIAGDKASDVFTLAVDNANKAPVLANEIQDQEATEDSVFNFTVPVETFSDADVQDILTYTATLANDDLLPTWLNFNPDTLTFTGTPTNNDLGSLDIKVTAKDIAGDEASDVFTLAVDEKTVVNTQSISLLTKITGDIFSIKTKLNIKGDKGKLSIKIKTSSSKEVNELGVFFVDDEQGKINGIAPGAEGYTQAALLRSKVIFSALANLPNGFNTADLTNILEFDSDTKLRFYLVSNSTTQDVLSGKTSFSNVLFSSATNNNVEDEGFSLNFQNLVVNIQATEKELTLGTGLQGKNQGELIDLRSQTQSVTANFAVNREASYNNYIGFYQVADENGGIDTNGDGKADILVGQAGYTQAAVRGRVGGIDLSVNNQGTANYTGTFQPGSIFAPFIIIDGRADAIVDNNANNDPKVYFSFLGANSDKVDHIRLLGNNTFGFEDLPNGGDKDYNDVIVRVNLSVDVAN